MDKINSYSRDFLIWLDTKSPGKTVTNTRLPPSSPPRPSILQNWCSRKAVVGLSTEKEETVRNRSKSNSLIGDFPGLRWTIYLKRVFTTTFVVNVAYILPPSCTQEVLNEKGWIRSFIFRATYLYNVFLHHRSLVQIWLMYTNVHTFLPDKCCYLCFKQNREMK